MIATDALKYVVFFFRTHAQTPYVHTNTVSRIHTHTHTHTHTYTYTYNPPPAHTHTHCLLAQGKGLRV